MALILTHAQAEAVVNAMAQLNNIGAKLDVVIPLRTPGRKLRVTQRNSGAVAVQLICFNAVDDETEDYYSTEEFTRAYGV